jgi:putative ABC transport system permease protein
MLNDLRYATRALLRAPGFTAMAAVTLALGIGANAAIFAVIQAVLLQPLPFAEPARLARLTEGRPDFRLNVSYPNFLDWRARSRAFEDMAICLPIGSSVMTGQTRAQVVSTGKTEGRLFSLLGIAPVTGRNFTADEEKAGGAPVVLISHGFWQRQFGGAPDVLGRSLTLDGAPASIVGVLPPEFTLYNRDVWFPLVPSLRPGQLDRGNHPGFAAYARLRDGAKFDGAQRELASIAADLERQYPASNARIGVIVTPLTTELLGGAQKTMTLLAAAVALLLLIACANVANVMLARGLHRQVESAVRAALGAERWRLVRLFLCEGLIVAVAGSALSVLIAAWAVRALRRMPGLSIPRMGDISMSADVMIYALALGVLTVLFFAGAPALQLSRVGPMTVLRQSGPAGVPSTGRKLRTWLIAVEVALSLMLLVGATLMLRTVARILSVEPGFDTAPVLAAGVIHPSDKYGDDEDRLRVFADRSIAELRGIPGVADAALIFPLTLTGMTWNPRINLPDAPFEPGREPTPVTATVTNGFFATMGIPLRKGRLFDDRDRPGAPRVALVNETFARRILKGGEPLGRRVSAIDIPQMQDMEIVGVVGDTKRGGLMLPTASELYVPFAQMPTSDPNVVVRAASGDPLALAASVDARIAAVDSDVPVVLPRRVSDILDRAASSHRSVLSLLGIFAALALVLTGLGIAGVVSFVVAERRQEIGVRMALGADAGTVLRMVVRSAMVPVIAGLAAGLVAVVPSGTLIRAFLFEVGPADPVSLAAGAAVLILAALFAAAIPALRATKLDPVAALRNP